MRSLNETLMKSDCMKNVMTAVRWICAQVMAGCIFAVASGAQADMKKQQINEGAVAAAAGLGDDLDASAMTVTQLRCEYLENPLGINVTVPRLSWWLESDERAQQGSAYQVLVASTPELLAEAQGTFGIPGNGSRINLIKLNMPDCDWSMACARIGKCACGMRRIGPLLGVLQPCGLWGRSPRRIGRLSGSG